ncbi:MAG: hypothetical protein GX801_04905 [Fibrobacter sp.]|nr:hypothetical protein [Fibrobacter sp.]
MITVLFILKPRYESGATLHLPDGDSFGSMQSVVDGLGALGSFMPKIGSDQSSNVVWTFFNSKELHDQVIVKFDLEKSYKFKGKYYADLLKKMRKRMGLVFNDEDMLEVYFEDEDPQVAKEVVEFMIHAVDSMYRDYSNAKAKTVYDFFAERTDITKNSIDSLSLVFAQFQKEKNMYAPEVQVENTISTLTDAYVRRDEVALELEVEALVNGKNSPRYKQLNERYKTTNAYLNRVRHGALKNIGVTKLEDQVDDTYTYIKYESELKILTVLYKLLRQKSEEASIEEAKKMQQLQVMHKPWANDKKKSPPRMAMTILVFLVANVIAMVTCVYKIFMQKQIEEDTELARQWLSFKNNLRFKK